VNATIETPLPPLQGLADATRPPGLLFSLGTIALYFALQAVGSLLLAAIAAAAGGFVPAGHGLWAGIQTGIGVMLERPGAQALLVTGTLMVSAAITLLMIRQRWPQWWSQAQPPGFGVVRTARPVFFAWAALIGLATPVVGGWLTALLAHGQTVTQQIQQIGTDTPLGLRLLLVLVVATLGPFVEELLFRGVLLSALMQRCRVGWAVAGCSLLFGLVHLPGLDGQWFALPDLILLAAMLAWLRLRSASIWPAVLAHSCNNLLAVVGWFLVLKLPG
jgi:membrane protease YdiL (CAAX protease family)